MPDAIENQQSLQEALESPELKGIVKFALARRIRRSIHHPIIEQVASCMLNPRDFKTAILYLESNDWHACNAAVQMALDQSDMVAYSTGKVVDRNAENSKIDRSLAKPGSEFDPSYLSLEIKIDGKSHTITFPHSGPFDPTVSTNINGLNAWRHSNIIGLVGLPKTFTPTGESWHPLQEQFLLNRYAKQNVAKRGVQYEKITNELNQLFEGVLLPGRYKVCERRSQNAVVSLLTRKAINPRAKDRKLSQRMSTLEKHEAVQKRLKQEREALLEKNKKRDQELFGKKEENEEDKEQDGEMEVCE